MKKAFLTIVTLVIATTLISCGGSAPAAATGTPDATIAANLTKQLDGVTIQEFPFNSARFFKVEDVKAIDSKVKAVAGSADFKAINKKGYKLYVIGHNDQWEKNGSVGLARAKAVSNELRGLGVDPKVLATKNAFDKEMVKDQSKQHPIQRRVTFKVMK